MKKFFFFFFSFIYLFSLNIPKEWYLYLHYKKTLFGYESLIDDKNFFVSKNGKYSPQDEFLASIKLIKTNPSYFACRFPLRYKLLNKKYNLSNFDIKKCKKLQDFLNKISASSVSIVFADSSMNKPASMFGHTFLRFDKKNFSPILSYAVNYAARVTDTNGILFAFKGIFGYYHGYYSILPYYKKIKQYNDIDSRDLWEYKLNLSKEEINKILLHIWELKDKYSNYYFFKENCAYNILYLINIAKNKNYTNEYKLDAIPLDTVKTLYENGLIKSFHYRPSLQTQIEFISKKLNNKEKLLIIKIAEGKKLPNEILKLDISNKQKAMILDDSVKYLEYLSKKNRISRDTYTNRLLNILKVRSKINYISNYRYFIPYNPIFSHNSKRFLVGIKKNNLIVGIRFAYHTLEDNDKGFKKGYSLAFFDFNFNATKKYFEKIALIELNSLSKRDLFFKPISWKVNFGFYRDYINDKRHLILMINPGGGFTQEFKKNFFYEMIETSINFNKNYEKNYNFLIGPTFGYFRYFNNDFFKVNFKYKKGLIQKEYKREFSILERHTFSRNFALVLKYNYYNLSKKKYPEFSGYLYYYF